MKQNVIAPQTRSAHAASYTARPISDLPLASLAGSDLSRRFRHWRGASGRRYLFSVFPLSKSGPLDDEPRFQDAVVLAVGRDESGARRILALDETGVLPELFYATAGFRDAVVAGADEVHIHLLTENAAGRAALIRDLASAVEQADQGETRGVDDRAATTTSCKASPL